MFLGTAVVRRTKLYEHVMRHGVRDVAAEIVAPPPVKETPEPPPPRNVFEIIAPRAPEPELIVHVGGARRPSVPEIIRVCAREFDVSADELLSQRRTKKYVTPRHIAMYLAVELTRHSFPAVARLFADRDHTTVLNAHRVIAARIQTDPALRNAVLKLRDALTAATIEIIYWGA